MKAKRSAIALVDAYLRAVIEDWAPKANTPTADRLAMSADGLRTKMGELDGPGSGLAESMGAGPESVAQTASDTVAEDVLRRSAEALKTLREDATAQTVGVGLDAAARIIKARSRAGRVGPSLALIGSGFFTDKVDGRQHDHTLAPRRFDPPSGWPCCEDLPGQRPNAWRLHDLRYGNDAPMTVDELDKLRADHEAEQDAISPRLIMRGLARPKGGRS